MEKLILEIKGFPWEDNGFEFNGIQYDDYEDAVNALIEYDKINDIVVCSDCNTRFFADTSEPKGTRMGLLKVYCPHCTIAIHIMLKHIKQVAKIFEQIDLELKQAGFNKCSMLDIVGLMMHDKNILK